MEQQLRPKKLPLYKQYGFLSITTISFVVVGILAFFAGQAKDQIPEQEKEVVALIASPDTDQHPLNDGFINLPTNSVSSSSSSTLQLEPSIETSSSTSTTNSDKTPQTTSASSHQLNTPPFSKPTFLPTSNDLPSIMERGAPKEKIKEIVIINDRNTQISVEKLAAIQPLTNGRYPSSISSFSTLNNAIFSTVIPSSADYLSPKLQAPKKLLPHWSPKGRWEWDFSYSNVNEEYSLAATRLVTQPTNPNVFPQEFVLDGSSLFLYPAGQEFEDNSRAIHIFRSRITRQMGSGVRLGLGLLYLRDRNTSNAFAGQLARDRSDYYFGRSAKEDYLAVNLSIGYTFLRRRRISPYIEFSLLYQLYDQYEVESLLFEPETGTSHLQDRSLFAEGIGQDDLLIPVVELGVQYQLGRHWSVGVLAIPYVSETSVFKPQ
ncbi:MAG: hypothetical protein AAFU67_14165, partial [Bacteroidota bacterium]